MDTNTKLFLVRFFSAMGVYLLMVVAAKWGLARTENSTIQHLLAVAPVIPVIVAGWILITHTRTFDEVQRTIMAESAVISIFIVSFGSLTYGFMQDFLDYPSLSFSWVLPALSVGYGLATFFVRRKYL